MSDSKKSSAKREVVKKIDTITVEIEDSCVYEKRSSIDEVVDYTMEEYDKARKELTTLLNAYTKDRKEFDRFTFKPNIRERADDDYWGIEHTKITVEIFGHRMETDKEVKARLSRTKKRKEQTEKNRAAKKVKELKELARLKKLYEK